MNTFKAEHMFFAVVFYNINFIAIVTNIFIINSNLSCFGNRVDLNKQLLTNIPNGFHFLYLQYSIHVFYHIEFYARKQ